MSGSTPQYVPLNCKSNYSFLEGASHPDELFAEARRLGLSGLGIVDRNGVYGIVRAHVAALEHGVNLHVGATVCVDGLGKVILLTQNRDGYANLCHLISVGRLRCAKGGEDFKVSRRELCEHSTGLVALGCPHEDLVEAFFGRLYVPVTRHYRAEDRSEERRARKLGARFDVPIVACNHVLYHRKERRALHDVVTCIRGNTTLEKAGTLIWPNAQYALQSAEAFCELFYDAPQACKNTLVIAEQCQFSLLELDYRYPEEMGDEGDTQRLSRLVWAGAQKHFGEDIDAVVRGQLDKELGIINELAYGGYFLTMVDIVSFCRREGILCQGRGSAANSLVCFCLGITAINPAEMNLLFERFLSRERAEPPDIDLDIEHRRREEVIQYVYTTYGRSHAAMVCNFIRYRPKSAVRDVGKVLGIPEVLLAQSSKLLSRHSGVDPKVLLEAGLDGNSRAFQHLAILSNEILDFPRHLSIHSGGFLLGREPVHQIVPIENATMPGRTVIQWDKEDIEELKLFKVDLLGLGALHHLHLCFDLLKQHRDIEMSMGSIPQGCMETYAMMGRADTIGVFQIESRAQMSMLPRLRPVNFYDLVIEISIIRPGPISGGMVHPFLRRRNGLEAAEYPHESLRPILEKTLGVPLFQEQVMRLAMVAADYSPGEADQLRRDMAAWRQRGKIERHRETLISRMQKKGIAKEFAERVFEQILGFGEYGFPESHAASFALIAYATSWLKWHYPAEFTCGLLNAQPMGFYSVATLVGDAQRHGVQVRPIDIQCSDWDCTLEAEGESFAIRMGLSYVKGLGKEEGTAIVVARRNRAFSRMEDAVSRGRIGHRAQVALASVGAFACFSASRREALWSVYHWQSTQKDTLRLPGGAAKTSVEDGKFAPLSNLDETLWDLQYSKHSPNGHPLRTLRPGLTAQQFVSAKQVSTMKHDSRVQYAGIVICRQRPGTANGVTFMTMEDETGFVNLVIWKDVFERYQIIAKTVSFLAVSGTVQSQEGVVHLVAEQLWEVSIGTESIREHSRDFR